MQQNKKKTVLILTFLFVSILVSSQSLTLTPVEKHGQLHISTTKIVDEHGTEIQLAGMSLFWSQWIGKYYNYNCIKWLRDDWKCTVVRAAMGVRPDGYAQNPDKEMAKIATVIDAAIDLGIYVIVDFHDHSAENITPLAKKFFADIAQKYGNQPNIIYELYNEPVKISWSKDIKPYAMAVIDTIRHYDSDNIIVCGTPFWSQKVDEAANDPLDGQNIAYTLHFYAGTHKESLMQTGDEAIKKGLCLFVTEYGTTEANGDGAVYEKETKQWYSWMDSYKISHCNWSVADKNESSAALVAGADSLGGWSETQIKPSAKLVRSELAKKYNELMK